MAVNTYGTYLMRKNSGGEYSKLADIKDYPDLGGSPEMLETTTLSDKMQTYIPGIQKNDGFEFTLNYDVEKYKELKALEGQELDLALWFGGTETDDAVTPDGRDGKLAFKGKISTHITGKGVNEVREMVLSIAPSTPIDMVE